MKVLITSGGTKIKIDRVRSITNMSKGVILVMWNKFFQTTKKETIFEITKFQCFILNYIKTLNIVSFGI
jgi:phosphopantothenoylcysteine synthetase/decarboxylase